MATRLPAWQRQLLARHRLASRYLEHAQKWFASLATALLEHQKGAGRPILVALNGCQGSGKTTLCDYLAGELASGQGVPTVALSLDDFYHTRARREQLARQIHPLLLTRGVPGTHDGALLQETLDRLLSPDRRADVPVPRFDKALDERRPASEWDRAGPGIRIVLLEGWCLGATPQSEVELRRPVNALEREEDPEGIWRNYVNGALRREFEPLYPSIDQWVMLCAPSFDSVFRWRLEQEQKLAAAAASSGAHRLMNEAEIRRFVQFFQRLTMHCLEHLPPRVDFLYTLDSHRQIVAVRGLRQVGS